MTNLGADANTVAVFGCWVSIGVGSEESMKIDTVAGFIDDQAVGNKLATTATKLKAAR